MKNENPFLKSHYNLVMLETEEEEKAPIKKTFIQFI
jgi:hypothetical protein